MLGEEPHLMLLFNCSRLKRIIGLIIKSLSSKHTKMKKKKVNCTCSEEGPPSCQEKKLHYNS